MFSEFIFHDTPVFVGLESISRLHDFISNLKPSKIFILVDHNTKKHCLPILFKHNPDLINCHIIDVGLGESIKSISNFKLVCKVLISKDIDRNSLILNLGGGVICDFGGFVSSVLKRGICFINIPTSLMSQVDASIGGKVGLNLSEYKNQIGLFSNPKSVIIYPPFLSSLPQEHILSAHSEIYKYALIYDAYLWEKISVMGLLDMSQLNTIMHKCVEIKTTIVELDYHDFNDRRKLNFGHSIGHAIESLFLNKKKPISHGFALSIGIICETYISYLKFGFSQNILNRVTEVVLNIFPSISLPSTDDNLILEYVKSDKKNSQGLFNFTLIKDIGVAVVNCSVFEQDILSSLDFYRKKCRI